MAKNALFIPTLAARRRAAPAPSGAGTDVSPDSIPVRSVRETNALVQGVLAEHLPAALVVSGEISNLKASDRGHAYFTLKDGAAELQCIRWKDACARLKTKLADGMDVLARGSIRMYEAQGRVQLYVDAISVRGDGALELAFRQLCEKLRAEGLFATERKRPLPRLPTSLVIVTSRTGSVLHDVLTTVFARFPGIRVSLFPVPVQGPTAAPKIIDAIERINEHAADIGDPQVLLLVRGGGSLEDLWPFNEESVARAIVASRIPIATGIGHEPDTTIADLVGDLRGPTPTGVAALVVPDVQDLLRQVKAASDTMTRDIRRGLDHGTSRLSHRAVCLERATETRQRQSRLNLDGFERMVQGIEPRHAVAQGFRRVDDAAAGLHRCATRRHATAAKRLDAMRFRLENKSLAHALPGFSHRLSACGESLAGALRQRLKQADTELTGVEKQLRSVGPLAVLDRGYSITRDQHGTVVRSEAQVRKGDLLKTRLADGEVTSTVGRPRQAGLF